jgi:hypothetical protein
MLELIISSHGCVMTFETLRWIRCLKLSNALLLRLVHRLKCGGHRDQVYGCDVLAVREGNPVILADQKNGTGFLTVISERKVEYFGPNTLVLTQHLHHRAVHLSRCST